MNMRKLSINKACVLLGTLLLLAVGAVCTTVYLLTRNIIAVRCVFLFSLFVLLCVIFFVALIRRKLVQFSDAFCGQMDDMLSLIHIYCILVHCDCCWGCIDFHRSRSACKKTNSRNDR